MAESSEEHPDEREDEDMRSITATLSITLDGVTQGLGRADEDTRGDFTDGGWGPAYMDAVMGQEMGQGMAEPGEMLFGRRTWQDFIAAWSGASDGNPFTAHMNAVTKYVVSRTLPDADAWANSVLLSGDAVETVSALRDQPGKALSIIGSVSLVQALQAADLIDTYTLLIHPLVLGRGTRLFDHPGHRSSFELTRSVPTTTGVIIATYRRR